MNINFQPSWKQHLAWQKLEDSVTETVLYGGAAGGGKTFLGCVWKVKRRIQYPNTRGLIVREERSSLVESTLVTYKKVLNDVFGFVEDIDYIISFNPYISCEFWNGSVEIFKQLPYLPRDPNYEYLGSKEYTDAFLEEASQIKEKGYEVAKSRVRWKLSEYNLIPKVLITCNPTQNWIYKEFYNPHRKGTLESDRAFIPALVTDNPDTEFVRIYLNSLNKIKDPVLRSRLRDGDWDYSDDDKVLFRQEDLINLFFNYHVKSPVEFKDRWITADTARYGKDSTVIYVWYGLAVIERLEIKHSRLNEKNATEETIEKITQLEKKHNVFRTQIIIDELGAGGGGVIDGLRGCIAFAGSSSAKKVNDNLFEQYNNLKSQCVYKLSEYIADKKIYFALKNPEIEQKIITEAKAHRKHNFDNGLKLSVTPKDEIKELLNGTSPDDFDNFIMRMFPEIKENYDPYAGCY